MTWIPHSLWRRRGNLPPLHYHEALIEVGSPVEVAPDVVLLRLPLPFALDHVNVYLLRDDLGWTIVDCGLDTPVARRIWDSVLDSALIDGQIIRQIIVTHHHPDHVGLAGWLAARCGAAVHMTTEEAEAVTRYSDPRRDAVAERAPLWHEHGLPADLARTLMQHMPRYDLQVHALPTNVQAIDTTRMLEMGGRRWKPLIGHGHSPQHLSLLAEDGSIMIGGDQVLPKITPNIAVWPGGDSNPLRSYLASLKTFEAVAPEALLLPSHKQPLWGISCRVEQIRSHHESRLSTVMTTLNTSRPSSMTGYDLLECLFGRALKAEEIGFGLGEAIAHLNFLEGELAIESELDSSGRRHFRPRLESSVN